MVLPSITLLLPARLTRRYYRSTLEIDDDGGEYANTYLPFSINPAEDSGEKVLAVPRCCKKRKGTQGRPRINDSVAERDIEGLERKKRTTRSDYVSFGHTRRWNDPMRQPLLLFGDTPGPENSQLPVRCPSLQDAAIVGPNPSVGKGCTRGDSATFSYLPAC